MICQAKSMNNFLLDVFISQAFLSNACQTLPLYGCSKVTCSYTFALSQHHQEQVAGRTYVILCVVDPSRGVGTGPAGPATARPKFIEPTIKNILYLYL